MQAGYSTKLINIKKNVEIKKYWDIIYGKVYSVDR